MKTFPPIRLIMAQGFVLRGAVVDRENTDTPPRFARMELSLLATANVRQPHYDRTFNYAQVTALFADLLAAVHDPQGSDVLEIRVVSREELEAER